MEYHYIEVKTNATSVPPPKTFLGSTIHGALIKALENIDTDIFQKFYKEKNNNYKYYRLDIAQKPDSFDFGIYLFDNNMPMLIAVLTEMKKFLSSESLTTYKYAFKKSEIFLNGEKILFDKKNNLQPFNAVAKQISIPKTTKRKDLAIHFVHPCFIGNKDTRYKRYLSLKDILLSAYKRKYFYENGITLYKLDDIKELKEELTALKQDNFDIRYINLIPKMYTRKKLDHHLEGMVGKIVIYNVSDTIYKALKIAEIVGIGKSTTLGLGKIEIELLNE